MGCYSEIFSFEINSQNHILDVIIEPSFNKAVCFQFHEMNDGSLEMFWNFEIVGRKIIPYAKEFVFQHKLPGETTFADLLKNVEYKKFIKGKCPISNAKLSKVQAEIIKQVVNTESPLDAEKYQGLDGHSYTFKVWGENKRVYECWCVLPKGWDILIPLIDMVVKLADLDNDRYGIVEK